MQAERPGLRTACKGQVSVMFRERSSYRDLVERTRLPDPPRQSSEGELDKLVAALEERKPKDASIGLRAEPDRVQGARELFADELVPLFEKLKEKYADAGVNLEMDVEKFLEGGREIRFRFEMGGYAAELDGVVTNEAIAFQETRHAPNFGGELVSGPMLRLRRLTAPVFREFICERLAVLVRTALRKR